jgi:hypothetical protein
MFSLALALAVTVAPFPLPTIDHKPLAVSDGQKVFRLPMRFEKVKAFYEERFGGGKEPGVTLTASGAPGERLLKLASKRAGDTWTRALVKEGEGETVVEVTPVIRMAGDTIEGNGKPLVEFIFGRSPQVKSSLESIDHTEDVRR